MRSKFSAPLLVALGAGLWSIDSLFRSKLTGTYSVYFILLFTQILCAFVTFPICFYFRKQIFQFNKKAWGSFFFLAIASNILAMACFTHSFAITKNYSVPILIQKFQPFVSIFAARFFLKEKVSKYYFPLAALAFVGSFLLHFNDGYNFSADFSPILYAFLAAILWGIGTVAGKYVSNLYSFWLVTSVRYAIATVILCAFIPLIPVQFSAITSDFSTFVLMAYVPGLIALFIYYKGLSKVPSVIACWLELSYPIFAVALNWIFLNSKLNQYQIAGAILLLLSATLLNIFRNDLS